MLDLTLLKVLRTHREFKRLAQFIPVQALEPSTKVLLDDFKLFFDRYKCERIDAEVFLTWFNKVRHPRLSDDERAVYTHMLTRVLTEDVPEEVKASLLRDLNELRLIYGLNLAIKKWDAGELSNFGEVFDKLHDDFKTAVRSSSKEAWVQPNVEALMQDEFDMAGLPWPWYGVSRCVRPARPGDFGIVAARPDRGKTTALAQIVTHWAQHLPPARNIVWLNNEGPGSRIYPRLWRAAIGTNLDGLKERQDAGQLLDEYSRIVGRADRIRVMDIHGMNIAQVGALLDAHNPGVIVYDMLDNIRLVENESRQDLIVEAKFQWAREQSVKHDCVSLATKQISGDGEGELFPSMDKLKDSKTGAQGACDFIFMIGASNAAGMEYVRGFGFPKNKLRIDGSPANPKLEVIIKPEISRYVEEGIDMQVLTEVTSGVQANAEAL